MPFLGDVLGADRAGPLQSTMQRCAGLGPIFELHVFAQKFVFVAGAELAAKLSDETRFHKALSPGLVALREFAGERLFTAYSYESNWQLANDRLRPAFTKAAMLGYHPIMLAALSELFDSWDAREGPFDVSAELPSVATSARSPARIRTRSSPRWSPPCEVASARVFSTRRRALACSRASSTVATPTISLMSTRSSMTSSLSDARTMISTTGTCSGSCCVPSIPTRGSASRTATSAIRS